MLGFVAYKQYFRGMQCQRTGQRAVHARVGLGATERARMQRDFEVMRDTDRAEVGIAIGQGRQPIAGPELLERREHVVERHALVARRVPHGKCLLRHGSFVADGFREPREILETQEREIVRPLRQLERQPGARFADVSRRVPVGDARVPRAHPIGENTLRAFQHRDDIPERIVEVEADCANDAGIHASMVTRGNGWTDCY